MRSISIAEAKAHFSECVDRAGAGEPVIITRHGKPVAGVVSSDDMKALARARARAQGARGTLLELAELEGMTELAEELDREIAARGMPRPVPDFE